MPRLAPLVSTALLSLCVPVLALAQDAAPDLPAHISFVDGAAVLERDGRSETAPASMPLLAGDRVRTQGGRVEVLFGDGGTLHLDANTVVDFQSDEVIRLLDGRVRLTIVGPRRRIDYRVDAPSAWIQIPTPGEYRISVIANEREQEVELAVLRGSAELVNEDGKTMLGAGERAFARGGAAPSSAYVFNSAAWDQFDRWSESRRDSRLGVSAEYLPETVRSYSATFNDYGYWQNEPTYGYVWYPRVAPGWRPYYYGRWTSLRPWGWTWIGTDPWAWPTHHFGRWGFNAGLWFWIPGRTWGPAWVSWAYAPGYVSWCPLGWDNRAVFGFNLNFNRGYRYDPWRAWTVVPHGRFGSGFVNVNVVNVTHIDVRTRGAFVVRNASPDFRGHAMPRSSAPIRAAGTRGGVGNVESGTASFSRTPGATPRVGSAPSTSDPTAAFRSRRPNSTPTNASPYPAPAREPRATSTIPSPARPGVSRPREGNPGGRNGPSDTRSPVERRAVPRVAPVDPSPSVAEPAPRPTVREVPQYRPTPGYGVPSPTYGAPRERSSPYRSPSGDAPEYAPRATPRSMPGPGHDAGSGPPAGYRSRPGPEHSAPAPSPSAPPPQSAAPSRPSGPPPAASSGSNGGGESRSRSSGGGSAGRATPRGRGGV